ncbi:MAG: hypothetical protein AB1508_14685 [Pseudomonadota bacterium]
MEKEVAAPTLPRWFVWLRWTLAGTYVGAIVMCVAGALVLTLIGAVVYRDFTDYQLYGNPWDPSDFPWYIIWSMRLTSLCGILIIAGLGFLAIFAVLVVAWPLRSGSPLIRQIGAASGAILALLVCAAWFGRWFG